VISRRTQILLDQLRTLYVTWRTARKERNRLRDDYVAILAEAEATVGALQAERDDLLTRVNARLVADGEPEITLDYFKDMP
jgi:hypothetical protein